MTIVEKILARGSGLKKTSPNEYVTAKIDMAMMPEAFRLLLTVLSKGGIREEAFRIWDRERFVVVTDHRVPPASLAVAENQKISREFAKRLNVKYFYDVFPGVCHQIMVEKGHVKPGDLIVGADSHTTTYGALNAASTGIGASEMAYVIQTGELWFRVPETIKFEINGKLQDFVHSKDIILSIAGKHTIEVAQYKAIEWMGSAVDEMSLDSRLTMGNMSVELGAKFGIFRADQKVIDYIRARTDKPFEPVESDPDAVYAEEYIIDGATLEPQVALPHSVGNVVKAREVKDIKIDQATIASCCHGRIEDLEIALRMLKGKKVYPGVRFYVAPASWEVYKEASERGFLSKLIESGVMIGNPTCGFCTGLQGVLAAGEKCIAATPRNFKGRMGSNDAEIYLASPATVTASAIAGKIVDPREVM
ncbi:MAG: 3-isopropylmalate dehydratase large subunit [Thermodesulfobacteriota bacterium]|nr:3-isopropylmalate dehydratase large subunit [Thermodesulfobacteriota bacterium]